MPVPLLGHVVPGVISPEYRRGFVTNRPYGPPIQPEITQSEPLNPLPTGDERSGHILQQLQKLLGMQKGGGKQAVSGEPITSALPGYRDWR